MNAPVDPIQLRHPLLLKFVFSATPGFEGAFTVGRARFVRLPVSLRAPEQRSTGCVRGVRFAARDGTSIDAWLFTPKTAKAPIVVMAPGLGGTKDGFLEPFAWKFVEHGVAALVFDYRCFGGSDGLPRHWVEPRRQREDYEAAERFAQQELALTAEVDGTRVGVWGSSFSGGTALMTAASNATVRAVVAQCPFLKTPPQLHPRGLSLARFVLLAVLDSLKLFPPIYVPLFGRPGEWVFASSRENPSVHDFGGPLGSPFWSELPKPGLGGWSNRMLARMLTTIDAFEPMQHVQSVNCSTLLVAARHDDMVPLEYVQQALTALPNTNKQLECFDCGHFDLYLGTVQARNAERQAGFLAEHLRATPGVGSAPQDRT